MSDPKYEHIGDRTDHLLEELFEFGKEVCKAKRFGWDVSYEGKTNRQRAQLELDDLLKRCIEVGLVVREQP